MLGEPGDELSIEQAKSLFGGKQFAPAVAGTEEIVDPNFLSTLSANKPTGGLQTASAGGQDLNAVIAAGVAKGLTPMQALDEFNKGTQATQTYPSNFNPNLLKTAGGQTIDKRTGAVIEEAPSNTITPSSMGSANKIDIPSGITDYGTGDKYGAMSEADRVIAQIENEKNKRSY